MKFYGFQKMTLLDFPGSVACTLFTGGCNFRCPFCHNASLVNARSGEVYEEEEILTFLEGRRGKLDGVAISGGEPLMMRDISDFMLKVKKLGYKIKLDTNGSFPEKLRELISASLVDYVAVDIKNSPEKYAKTCGLEVFDISKIEKTRDILLSGRVGYEFRTTVCRELQTTDDIEKIAKFIEGAENYFLQCFVDSGDLLCGDGLSSPSKEMLTEMKNAAQKYVKNCLIRGI